MKNYILKNENAVFFESGFSCDNVILIVLGNESFFLTDARYTIEAKEQTNLQTQVIETNELIKTAKKILKKEKVKKITYDPYDFCVADFNNLTQSCNTEFISKPFFSKQKRIIKTDKEIKLLKKAAQFGRDGFERFANFLNEDGLGQSEQFLYYKAQGFMSNSGKLDLSFDPIVAINANAAKPHALPTSQKLVKNDLLLVDAGIKYKRYCSDRTCTSAINSMISFHRDQKFTNKKQQTIYDIVRTAQEKAIKKARSGMKASKIDAIAREVIEKAGYGKYFVHSTGHGVGLDIHEYPNINSRNDLKIEDNMVFTIEPGIYLANEFGVRIEDTVVMQNGKAIIL